MENKVWFITGASKGLGLSLVKKALSAGYQVAATSRSLSELKSAIGDGSPAFLPLEVNVVDEKSVALAIEQTVSRFGKIDVVVNNAGYGLMGSLEELSDQESKNNFEVNVFGSLNVIRNVLPVMRRQKSGHILNVASIGGFTGAFPGFGIYCATKFAVHGFSESLYEEVKPFGIHVTVVSPGYFRTSFLTDTSLQAPENEIAEYTNVRETQAAHQHAINGNQPGDPEKAAAVMIEVVNQSEPPLHVFLGKDAYAAAEAKISSVQKDMKAMQALATATAF